MASEARTGEQIPLPGGDFRLLVQKLGYQALIALGVLDNPLTGERCSNPKSARSVVEDLRMLREKTNGNLAREEREHLDQVLAQLDRHLKGSGADSSAAPNP